MQTTLSNVYGDIQKWRHQGRRGGRSYPKLVTKSEIMGRGYMQIVTPLPKKLCISFYFSLGFGQCSSSNWDLGSILVVVSFQALAWVRTVRVKSFTKIWYSSLVVGTQIHINYEASNWLQRSYWSLVDLFNSCKLHISDAKYEKLFFKVFDHGK